MSDALVPYAPLHAEAVLANIAPLPRTQARPVHGHSQAVFPGVAMIGHDAGRFIISAGSVLNAVVVNGNAIYGHSKARELFVFSPPLQSLSASLGEMEKIQRELERLQDGWNGPGSKAPGDQTLTDFYTLIAALPLLVRAPEVEVDEDTGHLTLRWSSETVGLSFILKGSGKALMVKTLVGQPTVVSSETFDLRLRSHAVSRYLATDPAIQGALEPA